ncbi:centrosome and spindle pole-associated protein 1-like isoform X2 [Acanthochromis polyacanthus]|uniref:centrosome and spindle pole-associated protein 1-like isoform X2 n=1 Tax=Acanthochromis polyacanthus TaxID=80966 RepID=UPI0022344A2D|nr:centrosome and spindle pole-associated protein 1-like isoform X2 [Acanthochromis polyacanthus]
MEMDDELENFIRQRKARVAEDKASLQQDPPYMEIKSKPYRAYGSTVKENIPPKSIPQEKEDSCSVGLPLGVEYEKKKQRLQHELRMDYRRYMAQRNHFDPGRPGPLIHLDNRSSLKQHLLEDQSGLVSNQRSSLQRDAATLTEDNRGFHRAPRLTEVKTLCPEEDEEQLSEVPRHRDRLGRPVDQESEEEEYFKDELELMEGRRRRPMGVEASYEITRSTGTDGREKNTVGVAREGRRWRALTKNEEAEFTTGLIIGAADTDEALQRRKDRYRQELEEQIAEQHRNKKREKDLELKVAATGANDPEKQPDRIRQFGLSRRKDSQRLEPSPTGESGSSSRALIHNEKTGARERDLPPPEQPFVAFQSPVLEYSSALGLGGNSLPHSTQPAAPSFPSATDIPRNPLFTPHPPSLSEVYRSPYGEPHHYYGTRNLLDPNMAYYGHLSVPGAGLPMSYWNIPPGGASRFGNHSPHSQHSGSSFPEPPIQPSNDTAAVETQLRVFPSERSRSNRDRILSYREALKQQIQEQHERRRLEREEKERYEAQLEADMKNHQPWGRGGGGAPLRDSTGKLIADLNQMHKLNEEANSNPEQWQRRAMAAVSALRAELSDPNERVSGFTHVQTPQFARGKVFANQPTEQQLQEQDKYKAYLKQQIEEKMRKKAEERERTRLEEEREEKRLEEQRARIQREYEEEQERKKRKEMEQKAKNEELIQLAEQRKKEAEKKKKEAEEKENAALRKQFERERQARVEEVCREPSPPIPTLRKKLGLHQHTPRPPTVDSQQSTAPLSERSLSGLQSPPVPACRNQLRAAGDQHDLFRELSALRRQLRSEQKRLEGHMQQGDWEEFDSPLSNRHRERPTVDVFDMARLRLQAPVRRPNFKNTEPRNLQRIHDSLQLTDGESRLGSSEEPKLEEVGVGSRRRWDYKDPYHQLSSQRSTVQDDYFDLSPPQQNDYLRSVIGGCARGSLLESESAFIDPLGDASPVPQTPEPERNRQLSARERRRLAKQPQHHQGRTASSRHQDDYSSHSSNTLQREAECGGEWRSLNRTSRLMAPSRGGTAGLLDLSDDDSSPSRFTPHNPDHQSSGETVSSDRWTRPETSDTLKCLDHPLRRERLTT